MRLGYTVSSSRSLTSGRNILRTMRLGYALSEPSSHLTSGRDAPAQGVRLGVCVILVLGSLLPVIFATAAVCVPYISRIHSAGV
jgi:hypothetical protein